MTVAELVGWMRENGVTIDDATNGERARVELRRRLAELLGALPTTRILVVGDVGIDRYVTGNVERISPEAPVPIVFVTGEVHKLGLAANVSDNIHALGGDSELVGLVGKDRYAEIGRAHV